MNNFSNEVKIRPAVLEDIGEMSRIHAETWKKVYKNIFPQKFLDNLSEDFWLKGFQDMIINKRSNPFVAEINGKIVGDIIFGKSRDEKYSDSGEIYAIYVLPSIHRQGIGEKLMKKALEEIRKTGKYSSVFLKVAEENKNAGKFYESMSFINTGITVKDKIEDFYFNELIYMYDFNK